MLFYWYKTKIVAQLFDSANQHYYGTEVNHGKGLLCSDQPGHKRLQDVFCL